MSVSIRHKIFLILLLAIGLVVAGLTMFMTWSLEERFVRFIDARQEARIAGIEQRITKEYVDGEGWRRLDENELRWAQLLIGNVDEMPRHRPPLEDMRNSGKNGAELEQTPLFATIEGIGYSYLPVERRVMLLDADKTFIFGDPELSNRLTLRPIIVDHVTVGYLGVLPGPTLLHLSGVHFLDKQGDAFVLIALTVMLISAVLAFPFAGRLIEPLRAFTKGAHALAAGRYNTRISVTSGDELGQLASDFNSLAHALESNEALRRSWVADISHELRTPLSVLRGEIEALQDGVRPLDQKAMSSLHAEVMHLGRLVDDLYELSMSDVGSLKYRKTTIDPAALLRESVDGYMTEFRDKGIAVTLDDQAAGQVTINADPDRLAQLFDNLLSNSLRYTDGGGTLRISIARDGGQLLFDFMDSAPGVPPEDLPRLLERFFRAESSRNRAHGGAGLGLAICRNIVQAHGGTISAQASELGGVWVRVTLPV